MGRDDDHQIGLLLPVRGAAEQRAKDRHRADPGKLLDVALGLSSDSRPAIAKLWPSRNSTVVRASRLVSDGTLKPEICTACAKLSSLTDGARRRLMMPFARTVGVNVNCTPNGLYWMVMTGTPPVLPGCADGHRKFAAGQKRGGIAGERNQVGLGQSADQSFRFQGSQSNIKAGTLGGETGQRNAKGRCAGEQSRLQ